VFAESNEFKSLLGLPVDEQPESDVPTEGTAAEESAPAADEPPAESKPAPTGEDALAAFLAL
jgi:hypothetical protein